MLGFLRHLFIPHKSNNHRPKIIQNIGIFAIIIFFLIASMFTFILKTSMPEILGISYSISDQELLSFVNNARQERGLAPLAFSAELSDAARRKAADMLEKNYWAHFSPDGSSSPWGFIKAAGYGYVFAGENLAKGFTDSGSVVNAWMNSSSHRDNILSGKYRDVGFAVAEGRLNGEETVLVVELLGARDSQTVASVSNVASSVEAEKEKPVPTQLPSSPGENTGQAGQANTPVKIASLVSPTPAEKNSVSEIKTKPKIDTAVSSRAVSTVGLSFLAFSFLMDLVIVERKKIPRIVGHNLDHVLLILAFLLFLVLKGSGVVL